MKEKEHIISLLKEAKIAAYKGDVGKIRQLSDQTVHSSTIYQDEESILVGVIVYSLGKIIEKGKRYYKENFEKYLEYYTSNLDRLVNLLKSGDKDGFKEQIKSMLTSEEFSADLRRNASNMFRKAKINKAARIYEHGISMQRTSKLLGISLWELAEYAGQTEILDMKEGETLEVKKRIEKAMEIFR